MQSYPHFRNLTPNLFHHKPSVCTITDSQPAVRDNDDLIWSSQTCARLPRWTSKLLQPRFVVIL